MSLLSGPAIARAVEQGNIRMDPFNPALLNPASVDLTLGDRVAVYDSCVCFPDDLPDGFAPTTDGAGFTPTSLDDPHDIKHVPVERNFQIDPKIGWVLKLGIGYLMHTAEKVGSTQYVPVLDGKSSLGRLFVQIHVTAGYGDPGFFGQWTLEVVVTHSVRVYPGMRIAQMRFHELVGDVQLYKGRYNEDAQGPVASRAWQQFDETR